MKAILRGGPRHRKQMIVPDDEQMIVVSKTDYPKYPIAADMGSISSFVKEGYYSRVIESIPDKNNTYYFVWLGWKND